MRNKSISGRRRKQQVTFPLVIVAIFLLIAALTFIVPHFSDSRAAFSAEIKDGLSISYLDVGQGDSILIRTKEGSFILIDAGSNESETVLREYLRAAGVETIAYAVFTHPHEDHIGGGDMVLNAFSVTNAVMPEVQANTASYENLLTALDASGCHVIPAEPDVSFSVDDVTVTVLAPRYPEEYDLNNASAVLRLTYGDTSFLFTGDAERMEEKEVLSDYTPAQLHSDVLKVGHHGSTTSTTAAFLDAVSPSYAVISCGTGNDYGHPHEETLDQLNAAGITYARTDLHGTVVVYSDGETIHLVTEKEAE